MTDKKGVGSGDPLNLLIIGHPTDIYVAFIRAGWDETETVTRTSSIKTFAQSIKGFGYVEGVGEVTFDQPRGNLNGDPWFTDGFRLVLWVASEPVPVSDIEYIYWRTPY